MSKLEIRDFELAHAICGLNPIGPISDAPKNNNVVWLGISSGYQTLDVLAAIIFGLIVVNALKAKGYTSNRLKFLSVGLASIIAGFLLLVVYGGLCYLGATVSSIYPGDIEPGFGWVIPAAICGVVGLFFKSGGKGETCAGG